MKAKLAAILSEQFPTTSPSIIDDLADDLQAVVIRALVTPAVDDQQIAELEQRVEDVFASEFGSTLHNLIHFGPFVPGRPTLYRSSRDKVTKAALQTLLLEYDHAWEANRGQVLRERLTELNADTPALVN